MRHKDVKSTDEIPARTYRVTYRGEELFVESKGRDALARLPKGDDCRGWRIICEKDGAETRVVFDGNEQWAAGRKTVAA